MLKKIDYKFHFKPLMERKNEIMKLFKYYFAAFSQKKFDKIIDIDPSIETLLTKHNWPGNVFEVMNLAQNLINNFVSPPKIVKIDEIREILDNSTGSSHLYDMNYKEAKEKFEREFLSSSDLSLISSSFISLDSSDDSKISVEGNFHSTFKIDLFL